jgi:hypothetical protein
MEAGNVWRAVGKHEINWIGGMLGFRGRIVVGIQSSEEERHSGGVGDVCSEANDAFQRTHGLKVYGHDFYIFAGLEL